MSLSTKEYWEKRFIRNALINEKSALEYEKDLKKSYEATIASIKKEVEAFYGRYAEEGDISLAWAKEKLRPDKLHDFHMQAKKYLEEIEKMGDKPFTAKYEAHLKKLSGKAYVSQMDELVTNIRHNIETLSTGYNRGLGQTLENAYEEGFYRTMHDIQNRTKVGVSFTTPGGKQLEQAVKSKWIGENYSDRIWNDKEKLVKQLEPLLSQEFVRGRGSAVIAQELAGKLGVSYNNARRLIRTEMNHISNEASKKAYEESGVVDKYMFMATLDNRTSEVCSELDGKVIDVKEGVAGVNLPPLHPYCRSTTVPYFEDDDIGALIENRIARTEDGSGKSIALGENLNFKDWVEKYGSESFKARMAKRSTTIPEVPERPEDIEARAKLEEQRIKDEGAKQIPKSLKNHEAHIEKFLNDREEYVNMPKKKRQEVEEALAELIDNSVFAMRVPDLGILDIIMSSHFKNQFETNTSGGALNQTMRKDTAKKMFGIDTADMEAVDYEKYGYLSTANLKEDYSQINGAQFYGSVRLTFKRENVIDRTTFSAGDSLGYGRQGELVPPRVNNPSIAAFPAESVTYSDFGRHVKSLKANSKNVLKASDSMQNDYFELQYHGDLTIDDVETIAFPSIIINRFDRGTGKYYRLRKELMDRGIKVTIVDYSDQQNKEEEERIRRAYDE